MQEKISRRRLPHWDVPEAAYFVTTCLLESIPALGLLDLEQHRAKLEAEPRPGHVSVADWQIDRWKRTFARREQWLDLKPAARHLAKPQLAAVVSAALQFFAGSRYDLIAWVVMPSHYHWVYRPTSAWVNSLGVFKDDRSPRERIQHSVNRHSALKCNQLLNQKGGFWQRESYDHWIRSSDELERIVGYIHANPVAAGLVKSPEEYPFSSAFRGEENVEHVS
jgi:putative transposase